MLATARSLPASIAASAGRNPPVPTIATSTISAPVTRAISRSPSSPAKIRGLYSSLRVRMSILVSSTRQTDWARVSFAAAASFSALRLAASPTISILSGISRATFSALSPIDPVAPRITTRLRFLEVSVIIFNHEWTRIYSNDEVRMTNDELSPNDEIRNREEASVTIPLSFGLRIPSVFDVRASPLSSCAFVFIRGYGTRITSRK